MRRFEFCLRENFLSGQVGKYIHLLVNYIFLRGFLPLKVEEKSSSSMESFLLNFPQHPIYFFTDKIVYVCDFFSPASHSRRGKINPLDK